MSKMTKAIAVLGVVAGLGVAALPLSSYAAMGDGYKTSANAPVEVTVEGAVSIATNADQLGDQWDADAGAINLGKIMPGSSTDDMTTPLKVTVSGNDADVKYDLYINTLETDGALTGVTSGAKIAGGNVTDPETWGYQYSADGTTWTGAYAAVPAGTANAVNVNGSTKLDTANGTSHALDSYFRFKVSTKTTTTADTYRGTVVFTAVVE